MALISIKINQDKQAMCGFTSILSEIHYQQDTLIPSKSKSAYRASGSRFTIRDHIRKLLLIF